MSGAAFDRIVSALETCGSTIKHTGTGIASAQCPAHEDRSPSLSITDSEGQVLVHCHAGCSIQDVVAALNMAMADLFENRYDVEYRYNDGRRVIRNWDADQGRKKFRQTGTTKALPGGAFLYRVDRVTDAVAAGRPVFVVEGEKDVHALETLGVTATCSPMGAGKWAKVNPEPLYGATVRVIADQDNPGRKHAAEIAASLADHAVVEMLAPKVGKDAADHIAAGYGLEDFVAVVQDPATVPGGVTVRLADVVPERVDWLWSGRLPLGKIVVLDGDPSVGKSTVAVDCAARVSTGTSWPDGSPNRVGAVLLLSAEDGLADTIRPRLDAANGNPSNVHALTEVRYHDDDGQLRTRPATLADLQEIERAVRRTAAVLVVVDVLMAFLPGNVDSHRDQDVRGVLSGLAAMAERTGCCVLLLRHLNKSAGGSAMYRGGGSIGIIGAARVGLLAAHDPDDENRRVLAAIKSNLAAMPEALTYQLLDSPEHGCARVSWLGTSTHSAGALLAAPRDDDERTERDDAADWLADYLREHDGEAARRDVVKAAGGEGHSERTLQRALSVAKVVTARVGFPSTTVWRLAVTPVAPCTPPPVDGGATVHRGVTAETRGGATRRDRPVAPVAPPHECWHH